MLHRNQFHCLNLTAENICCGIEEHSHTTAFDLSPAHGQIIKINASAPYILSFDLLLRVAFSVRGNFLRLEVSFPIRVCYLRILVRSSSASLDNRTLYCSCILLCVSLFLCPFPSFPLLEPVLVLFILCANPFALICPQNSMSK